MKTRTYFIICPSCMGTGRIINPQGGVSTNTFITCAACNGDKRVLVTETESYTGWEAQPFEPKINRDAKFNVQEGGEG